MAKRRVKGMEGLLALDWVDALLILVMIYGLIGLDVWLFGDVEDGYVMEIFLFPGMLVGPLVRRFTLGVPVRRVKSSLSTSGTFATLGIVFGALIASLGGWMLYSRATAEPPKLEIPERDEFAERMNAEVAQVFEGVEVQDFDPDSVPPGVVVETIELGVTPRTPEQLEAEARAEHAEAMAEFRRRRMDGIFTALKIGGVGLLLLLLGGWLDSKRELEHPSEPESPPST